VEVLLLSDPVDAFWTSMQLGFEGKPLRSLSQGDVDFGPVPLLDEKAGEDTAGKAAGVDDAVIVAAVKGALGDRVSDVRASQRLTDSAACLVAQGAGPDRELERLLARQSQRVGAKPVLEINTRHPIVKAVSDAKLAARDADVGDLAFLLLDQAQILDGEVPDDPAAFTARLNRLVARGLAAG
jgi:molecular chaperone HtpG